MIFIRIANQVSTNFLNFCYSTKANAKKATKAKLSLFKKNKNLFETFSGLSLDLETSIYNQSLRKENSLQVFMKSVIGSRNNFRLEAPLIPTSKFDNLENTKHLDLNKTSLLRLEKMRSEIIAMITMGKNRHRGQVIEFFEDHPFLLVEYLKKFLDPQVNFKLQSDLNVAVTSNLKGLPAEIRLRHLDQVFYLFSSSLYGSSSSDISLKVLKSCISKLLMDGIDFTFQKYCNFLSLLITINVEKQVLYEILSELERLEPLIDITDISLRSYVFKWANLSTFDMLSRRSELLSLNNSRTLAVHLSPSGKKETYSVTSIGVAPRGLKSNSLVRFSSDSYSFYAKIVGNRDENYGCSWEVNARLPKYILHINNQSPIEWQATEIDNLSTHNYELSALQKLARRKPFVSLVVDNPPVVGPGIVSQTSNINSETFPHLNHSQLRAVRNALQNSVTLVQGPPGYCSNSLIELFRTGKTYTLANLVKAFKLFKKKVLVVSSTNSAIDNVADFCLGIGLKPIRMGELESIRTDLVKYTLEDPFDYKSTMRQLFNADVVLATAAGSSFSLLERFDFDVLIFDESSQVTEPSALVALMRCCETVVLFGDHKQLPASVSHEASLKGYDVSLFSRLAETIEPNLLTLQYRSHPMIMEFSSKLFYNGMLQNAVSPKHRIPPPGFPWSIDSKGNNLPVAFVNVDSYEVIQGSSKTNTKEARIVADIVQDLLSANVPLDHIGVISPYSAQNKLLGKLLPSGVELNSVDAYQGREKEVIVFSATRANVRGNLGFVSDERRFNVMHTRAKRGLVVVGNRDTLKRDPLWKQWFEWIDENNMQVSF